MPPISVTLPASYPEDASPLCDLSETTEYFTTPFLVRVEEAMTARLSKMPPRFSLFLKHHENCDLQGGSSGCTGWGIWSYSWVGLT